MFPDFQRLFARSNAVHHRDIAIILNFQPFSSDVDISYYLAVGDRNGKLAIATVSVQREIRAISTHTDISFHSLFLAQRYISRLSRLRLQPPDYRPPTGTGRVRLPTVQV